MPGIFSTLQKGASYVGRGYSYGAGHLGRTGMGAATGAAVGGLYGATLGRDPGQSWYGGAFTGALGGAGIGAGAARYGGRAYSAGMVGARFGGATATGGFGRIGMGIGRGGRAAFRAMRPDARMARRFIGNTLTKGVNSFGAIGV